MLRIQPEGLEVRAKREIGPQSIEPGPHRAAVPALAYTVPYAIGNILLPYGGPSWSPSSTR
jgi:hypothetical protein